MRAGRSAAQSDRLVSVGIVAGRDDFAGRMAGGNFVAQISNLLCRRLPVGRPLEGRGAGGLETCATMTAHAGNGGRGKSTYMNVKAMAPKVLEHRLVGKPESEMEGRTASAALAEILAAVPALAP